MLTVEAGGNLAKLVASVLAIPSPIVTFLAQVQLQPPTPCNGRGCFPTWWSFRPTTLNFSSLIRYIHFWRAKIVAPPTLEPGLLLIENMDITYTWNTLE